MCIIFFLIFCIVGFTVVRILFLEPIRMILLHDTIDYLFLLGIFNLSVSVICYGIWLILIKSNSPFIK